MFGMNRAARRKKYVDHRVTKKGVGTHKAKNGIVYLNGVEAVDNDGNKLGREVMISQKDLVPDGYEPDRTRKGTNNQRVRDQRIRSGRFNFNKEK